MILLLIINAIIVFAFILKIYFDFSSGKTTIRKSDESLTSSINLTTILFIGCIVLFLYLMYYSVQMSVLKGDAGNPSLLNKVGNAALPQPYRTATGFLIVLLDTIIQSP